MSVFGHVRAISHQAWWYQNQHHVSINDMSRLQNYLCRLRPLRQ